MATYAIGDVQGCYDSLMSLLDKIHFNEKKDCLWFAGDIVNRGDKSLATIRFIKNLGPGAITVLGNHDLTLLAIAEGYGKLKDHTLDAILKAPDREELLSWLRHQPLLHYDKKSNFVMVHAGLPPQWNLKTARKCAREVENILTGPHYATFFAHMFGNNPARWSDNLTGWDRLRVITNCFTRMRFCDSRGNLDMKAKGRFGSQARGSYPWFEIADRKNAHLNIIFGHWSTLMGKTTQDNVYALDTGCLWGGALTAMKISRDPKFYSVDCKAMKRKK